MTDLLRILPSFPTAPFASLLPVIERHALTTTDLLALHPADIAKQTHLPLLDLKRLIAAVQDSLANDLTPQKLSFSADDEDDAPAVSAISTLDDDLDAALGGGVPVGRITEFAGESGAGKTQFLLSLCLAVQLPAPRGLGKKALYISTESKLSTQRLAQMLAANPLLAAIDDPADRPSLDGILSTDTPDLESQDHILQYQVPVLLARHDVGLLVLDSIAANYRAEFERRDGSRGSNMAARSADLVRLGALLRDLARRHGMAVVVANQVADRFSSSSVPRHPAAAAAAGPSATQESPLASRSMPPPSTPMSSMPFSFPDETTPGLPALQLDHQQRWFTGWGDDPDSSHALKTPSLGLVWTTQIACRIALFKRPVYGLPRRVAAPVEADDDGDVGEATLKNWRRWMKVVFAPHVAASPQGLDGAAEFEVTMGGLKAVKLAKKGEKSSRAGR